MDNFINLTTYTASEARAKLYSLIKTASKGLKAFEIQLRGSDPVVLLNKSELLSWQETLDILSDKEEIKAVRKARKQRRTYTHKDMLKAISVKNETAI